MKISAHNNGGPCSWCLQMLDTVAQPPSLNTRTTVFSKDVFVVSMFLEAPVIKTLQVRN